MDKYQGKLGSLAFLKQLVREKENSEFKLSINTFLATTTV